MATINNVVVPNVTPVNTSTAYFNQIWYLTRALKKAGWKYIASGYGPSTEETTGNPAIDAWNDTGGGSVTNAGATSTGIAFSATTQGRATITGLTGIVSADKGRFLTISGAANGANNNHHQIEEIVSATSVRVASRAESGSFLLVEESAGASVTWTIRSPVAETYPTALNGVAAWWAARGPSILKVPIGSATPSPGGSGLSFLRGENVVQATSDAEGEILGVVTDTVGGTGYLVIAPRVRGTGADPYGWSDSDTITGALSGASVTATATVREYRNEIVFWKSTTENTGTIYMNTLDIANPTDGSDLSFATLAVAAGTTPVVAPGGGGTGNGFPTHGWLVLGLNTTNSTPPKWPGLTSGGTYNAGNAQIICVDAIEEENHTADASWLIAFAETSLTGGAHGGGLAFQRLDDHENGDLHPYVAIALGVANSALYTNSRTTITYTSSIADRFNLSANGFGTSTSFGRKLFGWRRYGLTAESFQEFEGSVDQATQTSSLVMATNPSTPAIVSTAVTTTKVREPLRVVSIQASFKMHKGTLRWLSIAQGGNGTDTYDDMQFLQLSPNATGPVVVGPWDGVTVATTT